MRIRLSINRYSLGSTKIWWDTATINEGRPNTTISMLLESINEVFQLETQTWGLEDYVVEVNGWELLHFQNVDSLLREGDEVVIRPLDSHEIRERRRTGRQQISTAGRRLVDGVPFGRTFLGPTRARDRPDLGIPARGKRRKVEDGSASGVRFEAEGEDDEDLLEDDYYDNGDYDNREVMHQLGWNYGDDGDDDEDDDDDDNDEDYEDESDPESEGSRDIVDVEGDHGNRMEVPELASGKGIHGGKSVSEKAMQKTLLATRINVAREGVGISNQTRTLDKIRSSVSCESSSRSSSESSSTDSDSDSIKHSNSESSSDSESDSENSASPSAESDTNSDSDSSSSSASSPLLTKPKVASKGNIQQNPKHIATSILAGIPGAGNSKTVARRERLKRARARSQLVSAGVLPANSSSVDYLRWLEEHPEGATVYLTKIGKGLLLPGQDNVQKSAQKNKATPPLADPTTSLSVTQAMGSAQEVTNPHGSEDPSTKEEAERAKKRRKKKCAQARKKGLNPLNPATSDDGAKSRNDLGQPIPSPVAAISPRSTLSTTQNPITETPIQSQTASQDPNQQRQKNDWIRQQTKNASNKKKGFLNKMAGLTPKKYTYDDAGNRIEVPTNFSNFSGSLTAYEDDEHEQEQQQQQKGGNVDDWKKKIVLSAVECENEELEVTTPTFPFIQPSTRVPLVSQHHHKGQKRKRGEGKKRVHWDEYEYRDDDGQFDAQVTNNDTSWNNYNYYDDESIVHKKPTRSNVSATIISEEAPEQEEEEEDLPPLPANITTLPELTKDLVTVDAIITFKQLSMDEHYNPIITNYRTALVTEVEKQANGELTLWVKLAKRDRPKKRYDEETGERLLGKFEMPGEDTGEGVVELQFTELMEPRIVKAVAKIVDAGEKSTEFLATASIPPRPDVISAQDAVMGNNEQNVVVSELAKEICLVDGGEALDSPLSASIRQEERELIIERTTDSEAMDLDQEGNDTVDPPAADNGVGLAGSEGAGGEEARAVTVVEEHEEEARVDLAVGHQVLREVGGIQSQERLQNDTQIQHEARPDVLGGIESFLGLERGGGGGGQADSESRADSQKGKAEIQSKADSESKNGGATSGQKGNPQQEESREGKEVMLPQQEEPRREKGTIRSQAEILEQGRGIVSAEITSPKYTPWTDDEIENFLDEAPTNSTRAENENNAAPEAEKEDPKSPQREPQPIAHSPLSVRSQDSWSDDLPQVEVLMSQIRSSQKARSPAVKEEPPKFKLSPPSKATLPSPPSPPPPPLESLIEKPTPQPVAKKTILPQLVTEATTSPQPITENTTLVSNTQKTDSHSPSSTPIPKKPVVGRKTIVGRRISVGLGPKARQGLNEDNRSTERFGVQDVFPLSAAPSKMSSSSKSIPAVRTVLPNEQRRSSTGVLATKNRTMKPRRNNESEIGNKSVIDLTESDGEDEGHAAKSSSVQAPSSQPVRRAARENNTTEINVPLTQPIKKANQVVGRPSSPLPGDRSQWRALGPTRKF